MHEHVHSAGWKVRRGLGIAAIALVAGAALGLVVMGLWNLLMPGIFGLKPLGFWQALGLLILARILFGGFHRAHGPGFRHRRRMLRRWERMTPEEREKFREGFRGRFCGCGTPAPDDQAH